MFISFNFQKKDLYIIFGILIYLIEILPWFKKCFLINKLEKIPLKILYQNVIKIIFYIPYYMFFKKQTPQYQKQIDNKIVKNKYLFTSFFNNYKNDNNNNDKLYKNSNLLILIIFLSIADFFQVGIFYYDFIYDLNIHKLRIFFIILILIFNHYLLNLQMYKHHIFSLIILIIYGMFVLANDIGVMIKYKSSIFDIFSLIIDLNQRILLMIEIIGLKYLIHVQYINKFYIYFIQGIIELILWIFLFGCIIIFIPNIINIDYNFCIMIIDILFYISKNFITILIIEELSPCYIGLIKSIINIPLYMLYDNHEVKFIYDNKIILSFVYIIGFILQIVGILVYSENIILNFCGLNKDIEINILIREEKEKEYLKSNNDNDIL